jgi:hypothetical protein
VDHISGWISESEIGNIKHGELEDPAEQEVCRFMHDHAGEREQRDYLAWDKEH